jgi:hypothetical protein
VQAAPLLVERFALDMTMGGRRELLVYFVIRQAGGGATLVARLLPADAAALSGEVERIARSVRITRQLGP